MDKAILQDHAIFTSVRCYIKRKKKWKIYMLWLEYRTSTEFEVRMFK